RFKSGGTPIERTVLPKIKLCENNHSTYTCKLQFFEPIDPKECRKLLGETKKPESSRKSSP
ncbi:hypothetical protein QT970_29700, partial [Microcoleus sp. herbarium8]|uniref:hypothetical protein n=1 Tax=Microcoleus sp. herbarium8 TaxID=3055436 RepID=UPI002FD111E5